MGLGDSVMNMGMRLGRRLEITECEVRDTWV